ncbi:MAG: sensor histidine kinase [Flavobacterium sp.]
MIAKRTRFYLLHILGALLILSIPILLSPDLESGNLINIRPFRRDFIVHILLLAYFYLNYLNFIPKLFFSGKRILFFTVAVAAFLVIALLPGLLVPGARPHLLPPPPHGIPGMPPPRFLPLEGGAIFQFMLVFFLSILLRINQRLNDAQNEKLKSEVSYLKAQINPHFLFNTLNSLYALSITKSDEAPNAVLKLSGMMRYVVTESSKDQVALEKEIEYIKNYISLQQLRMDGAQFSFSVTGNPIGKSISPLMLIPFIENAFKYGLNPERKSDITITIDIEDSKLNLHVKNNKVVDTVSEEDISGMGIENTRQRLHYLYPQKHKLLIFDTDNVFEVKLTLTLA